MRIYLAGRFSASPRLKVVRERLKLFGHEITSTWLDEPEGLSFDKLTDEERRRFAIRDLLDLVRSQILALDLLQPPSRGGCEVEFGFALAESWHKTTYVIGQQRNIFHFLAAKTFKDWEEFIWHVRPKQ